MKSVVNTFLKLPVFAVVGASAERQKYGNKVLRCYMENNLPVFPISQKMPEIEGLPCVSSLSNLAHACLAGDVLLGGEKRFEPSVVGVSIVTPPAATRLVLQEGFEQGFRNFFLQPGTTNAEVDEYIMLLKSQYPDMIIIESCVLVALGFDEHS
jgi:uncharacterized protein